MWNCVLFVFVSFFTLSSVGLKFDRVSSLSGGAGLRNNVLLIVHNYYIITSRKINNLQSHLCSLLNYWTGGSVTHNPPLHSIHYISRFLCRTYRLLCLYVLCMQEYKKMPQEGRNWQQLYGAQGLCLKKSLHFVIRSIFVSSDGIFL